MSSLAEQLAPTRVRPFEALRPWLTVSSNLDPRRGGVSSVMSPLCRAIRAAGSYDISLAAFCQPDEDLAAISPGMHEVERYRLAGIKSFLNPVTRQRLDRQIAAADGVHIHGLWQDHSFLAARLARSRRKPYILSAHGMLDPWALKHKGFKKALYLNLIEKSNLRHAACLHALSSSEAQDYRQLVPGVPIAIIPNGVSVPERAYPELFLSQYPHLQDKRIVLFLSRLHRKKGLDILCRAWRDISARQPDAHLVLAGPDAENTRASIPRLVAELGIAEKVTFTGMLRGQTKWSALAASELFVLPSYSEGLSVAVLEAMGMSRPVLISRACHVDGVTENLCGWEIEPRAQEIEGALTCFFALSPSAIRTMGERGSNLVRNSYCWEKIGKQMSSLYQWAATGTVPIDVELIK